MGVNLCETPISSEVQTAFVQHMSEYGLSFGTEEEYNLRLSLFAAKDAEINEINASQDSFVLGHNQFSTWTDYEYKKILGFKMPLGEKLGEPTVLPTDNLKDSVDWRE
jgi:hypothetical protein